MDESGNNPLRPGETVCSFRNRCQLAVQPLVYPRAGPPQWVSKQMGIPGQVAIAVVLRLEPNAT